MPNAKELFAAFFEDQDVFNAKEGNGKILLYPIRDITNQHILDMKARDKSGSKKGRRIFGQKRTVHSNPFVRPGGNYNQNRPPPPRVNNQFVSPPTPYNGGTKGTFPKPKTNNSFFGESKSPKGLVKPAKYR